MPSRSDEFAFVSREQWSEIQESASQLDNSLLAGAGQVNLLRFLPPPGASHRRAALLELVRTEMEFRYRRDESAPLEKFCDRYHELGGVDGLPPRLIYDEYRVRRLYGDRPDFELYRKRFPAQFHDLCNLMRESPLPTSESPGQDTFETLEGLRDAHFDTPEPPTKISVNVSESENSERRPPTSQGPRQTVEMAEGFEFIDLVGRGEYGEVWKARRKAGGGEVAVKKILRSFDDAASQRELATLQQIRDVHHPYLLQTQAFFVSGDHLYIVMDLADGSLSARFDECREKGLPGVPAEELVEYITQAAEGLDYLHSRHIIHRDIKPQNLLMLQGYAKVADFGFARGFDQPIADVSILCGTPHYMAPEIWRQQISVHSDQYALAASYYEVRTGRRPFAARNALELALEHANVKPDVSGVSKPEQAVLKRALEKNPSDRFRNCSEFAEALQAAIAPPPQTTRRSSSRGAFAFVAVLVAAVGVTAAVVKWGGTGGTGVPTDTSKPNPQPEVSWIPREWQPVDAAEIATDLGGRKFYRRIQRKFGTETVVLVVVVQRKSDEPSTFYIMENKVWNDLFRTLASGPKFTDDLTTYTSRPGCKELLRKNWREEWLKGGHSGNLGTASDMPPFLGTDGGKGRFPVFRLSPTEAHCFAVSMDGLLPTNEQWMKAAAMQKDIELKSPLDPNAGPQPVDSDNGDVSDVGCRQMRTNGREWTRDVEGGDQQIPLKSLKGTPSIVVQSCTYESDKPLLNANMRQVSAAKVTDAKYDISFRVVLQQP